MTVDRELPNGWTAATVGELATYQNGRAFKPSEWGTTGLPIIRIQNLNESTAAYNYSDDRHEERFRVKHSDLLFAWSASLGAHIWRGDDAWLNQHIFRVDHANQIDRRFLFYALTHITSTLYSKAHGSGMVHVTKGRFEETDLGLPPLNEQRRIAERLDEIVSELEAAADSLTRVIAELRIYRKAVLKHAFEGKLTVHWREENKDRLETPEQLIARIKQERETRYEQQLREWRTAVMSWEQAAKWGRKPLKPSEFKVTERIEQDELTDVPHLPRSWQYVRLSEIADIGSGMSLSKSRRLDDPIEVPYLSVANVQRGELDLSRVKTMRIERAQLATLELKQRDVLFNEGGDRDKLGRGWIWESQIHPCITQNHVFRASPFLGSLEHSKWISHWGNSFGQRYFETYGKQTTNLASINKTVLSKFPVPLPPIREQVEILRRIDVETSTLDHLEASIAVAHRKLDVLRLSILKMAFKGQLVPQDPNDEPASILLDRIRAEREQVTKDTIRRTAGKRRVAKATA